jgi:mannose-6-phosphate isomerase
VGTDDPPAQTRVAAPLRLEPVLVAKPWGGRTLEQLGRALPDGVDIGESWDVADLDPAAVGSTDDPTSRVASGPHTGRTLSELIATDADGLLGASRSVDGRFPVLVKLLDAREPLSVQVHPPAGYVADHPEVHLKTESWVVLEAEPDASLLIGVRSGVTLNEVVAALGTPAIVPLLREVPARPGEVHHLPAGTVHALGGGVLVAEVQTPSDTTFRVYDWIEELGRDPRPLHLEAAAASIEEAWEHNRQPPPPAGRDETELVTTDAYALRRWFLADGEERPVDGGHARVVQVLTGELVGAELDAPVPRGGTAVLPAAWRGTLVARGRTEVLETQLP